MSQPTEIRLPSPPSSLRRRRRWLAAAIIGTLCVLTGVLYHFPPTAYSFYPRCIFHDVTGLNCPGCGGTRCAFALLHGDVAQAAAYNILVLLYLPYLLVTAFNGAWHAVFGRPIFRRRMPGWTIQATAVLMVLFWLLRNLPWAPFTLLAPHKL